MIPSAIDSRTAERSTTKPQKMKKCIRPATGSRRSFDWPNATVRTFMRRVPGLSNRFSGFPTRRCLMSLVTLHENKPMARTNTTRKMRFFVVMTPLVVMKSRGEDRYSFAGDAHLINAAFLHFDPHFNSSLSSQDVALLTYKFEPAVFKREGGEGGTLPQREPMHIDAQRSVCRSGDRILRNSGGGGKESRMERGTLFLRLQREDADSDPSVGSASLCEGLHVGLHRREPRKRFDGNIEIVRTH